MGVMHLRSRQLLPIRPETPVCSTQISPLQPITTRRLSQRLLPAWSILGLMWHALSGCAARLFGQ